MTDPVQWIIDIAELEMRVMTLKGRAILEGNAWAASFLGDVREQLRKMSDRAEKAISQSGSGVLPGDFGSTRSATDPSRARSLSGSNIQGSKC